MKKDFITTLGKIIPKGNTNAQTTTQIQLILVKEGYNVPLSMVKKGIKVLRMEKGYPILWCSRGIFQTYNRKEIERFQNTITNSIRGYTFGMTRIKEKLEESIV